jgi:SAM-dependent methyltransferase
MMRSILVRLFGFPATLIHGDTGMLDRWVWLNLRLPKTDQAKNLIDVGCGSGAFTIGAALRGYECLGLDLLEGNILKAKERAGICRAANACFETLDLRFLDQRSDLHNGFDIAICLEVVEHLLDDRNFVQDIAACLKPGGRLLLTTPNFDYRPITREDEGTFPECEGGHVRKGYTEDNLVELFYQAGLVCDDVSYCTGFLSQKITWIYRTLGRIHPLFAWAVILPLRVIPQLLDSWVTKLLHWPCYSICIEAHKPA